MNKRIITVLTSVIVVIVVLLLVQNKFMFVPEPSSQVTPSSNSTPAFERSTPQPSPTSKPLSYPTITIPNQDAEQKSAMQSSEGFLITFKEKNWVKQYDKVLHSDSRSALSKDQYTQFMQKAFGEHSVAIATAARVDFIKDFKPNGSDKTYDVVAVIQPVYLKEDRSTYFQNDSLDFLYFAKDSEGFWRLLWFQK
ncbi:MAG: hypothetical protein WCP97_00850 [bacterium]